MIGRHEREAILKKIGSQSRHYWPTLEKAIAHIDEATNLLRKIEWSASFHFGYDGRAWACPCCFGVKPEGPESFDDWTKDYKGKDNNDLCGLKFQGGHRGHKPGCELARLLG